jgi:hypothetical protein
MTYISKDGSKTVEVLEVTQDGFVRFITNGIEVLVAKTRFEKMYEREVNEAK